MPSSGCAMNSSVVVKNKLPRKNKLPHYRHYLVPLAEHEAFEVFVTTLKNTFVLAVLEVLAEILVGHLAGHNHAHLFDQIQNHEIQMRVVVGEVGDVL